MRKVKVAQIGTSANSHGNQIFASMKRQSDLFEIVGYALPENERIKFPKKMPLFADCREMTVEEILADPQIEGVVVETEEIYLTKYALMVAKAGKHLHMEKPGGTNPEEFRELIRILREKNLVFTTGYMYRFNPKVVEALERIQKGELGEIFAVEAHMDCLQSNELRQWLSNFPGGMMFFLGCHLIDLIYQIQGEPLEVIPFNCSTGIDGVQTQDYGMAVFRYPNGISFAKTCGHEYGGFLRRQLVICGSKGTLELNPIEVLAPEGLQYTVMKESLGLDWHTPGLVTQTQDYNRYDPVIENFARIILGERENRYDLDYEWNLYKLILHACGKACTP